ncbi:FAD-dependent oxidoreductase [Streptomyces sp. CA-132043]|uniref:FAD-dependent oxidoreductase n=1 Tax=Streptomyces sp. CA-132043 TaxID=3240048 RepID=UPI003D8C3360
MRDTTPRPHIAIVGAGPGGLLCARILQRNGQHVTVFEREPAPDARAQGGTLDIHDDTGQLALRDAGLLDTFRALARAEGQEWRVLDPRTAALTAHQLPDDGEADRPEIDRGLLRRLLLDSLAPGTVRWGCPVDGVVPLGDGTGRLRLSDATELDFDLVIGADGAWSRVRPALSDAVPAYTGITFVGTGLSDVGARHPDVARLVGHGTMMARADEKGLITQRTSSGRLDVVAAFRAPRDWHTSAGVGPADTAAVRAHLLERFDGWHDSLLALLRDNDEGFVDRPLFALPVPHTWHHVPGVTLLGDAAHLMPPLGVGANLAILDGADLAKAIVREATLDDAVRAYESVMLPRSVDIAKQCVEGLADFLPEGSGVEAGGPMMTTRTLDGSAKEG